MYITSLYLARIAPISPPNLPSGSVYITSLYLATVKGLWFASRADATLLMQQLVCTAA